MHATLGGTNHLPSDDEIRAAVNSHKTWGQWQSYLSNFPDDVRSQIALKAGKMRPRRNYPTNFTGRSHTGIASAMVVHSDGPSD
jgi:hypothetical protein